MITKTECLNLLFDLKNSGIDCQKQIFHLIKLNEPDIQTIKFINDNQELNVRKFYEKLRLSYNNKRSKLYKNIVSINDKEVNPKEVICTLASLQLQILLFNKTLDDSYFLQNARYDDVCKALYNYYVNKDVIPCIQLLSLIKSDLKILEEISKTN